MESMSMPLITGVGKQDTLPSCHRNSFFLSHVHTQKVHTGASLALLVCALEGQSFQSSHSSSLSSWPLTQHTLLQSLCIHLSHINSSLCSSVTLTRKSIFIFFFSSLLCFTHICFPFLHLSTAFLSTIYSVFFSPSFTAILSISQPNSFAFSSFSASPGESALDNFLLC